MRDDIDVLHELERRLDIILKETKWNSIHFTVPGSLEKVIEAKGGILDAHKRTVKAIAFIEKKLEERNNEDTQEG